MDRIMGHVKEEWFILAGFNEVQRFIGQPVGEVISWLILQAIQTERGMIAATRPAFIPLRNLQIKTLSDWAMRLFP